MAIVYVTQEQAGKNILPALKYGEISVMFPPDVQVGFSAGQAANQLMFKLSKYRPEDYLLLIGDPILIGIATAVASYWSNGDVSLLKWDRQEKMYYPVKFSLHQKRGELNAETFEKTFVRERH